MSAMSSAKRKLSTMYPPMAMLGYSISLTMYTLCKEKRPGAKTLSCQTLVLTFTHSPSSFSTVIAVSWFLDP